MRLRVSTLLPIGLFAVMGVVLALGLRHDPKVLPSMLAVRGYADALESVVADDLWPLPSYQEMLFIR